MEIDHLTFSSSGGAGRVAQNLANSQIELGASANLHKVIDGSLRDDPLAIPSLTLAATLDEYILKNPASLGMVSCFRRKLTTFDTSNLRQGAVLHLHWIEGVVSTKSLIELLDSNKKTIWTIHDMSPFTGGCHQSLGCNNFETDCQLCPQVRKTFQGRIGLSLTEKLALSKYKERLTIVAPSRWLSSQGARSHLFKGFQIQMIENPISKEFFGERDKQSVRDTMGITEEDFVVAVVAAQLNNPLKRVGDLIKSLLKASNFNNTRITILAIGAQGEFLAALGSNVRVLGSGDSSFVAEMLSAADIVVSASPSESAGMFVREAGALGLPAFVLSNGGSDEMIANGQSGLVFKTLDELAISVLEHSGNSERIRTMGRRAKVLASRNADPISVARKYLSLYA